MNNITSKQWNELNDQEKQIFQNATIGKNYETDTYPSDGDIRVFLLKKNPESIALKEGANGGSFNESDQDHSIDNLWEMVKLYFKENK